MMFQDNQEITKKVCLCSFISLFLIVFFLLSPLKNIDVLSMMMRCFIIFVLGYTIYLNCNQTNNLSLMKMNTTNSSPQIVQQLQKNILTSYVFTFILGLLIIYVIKGCFSTY